MATYYVSTTGSDTNTGGAADPFLTVDKGVSVAGAGDTVNVAAGTYVETATVSPGAAISIVGATGTASDVVIKQNAAREIVAISNTLTISDITLDQDTGGTNNDTCLEANWRAVIATNCTFKTTLGGIDRASTGTMIKRCRFIQQKNSAGNWVNDTECYGLYSFGPATIESCLFQDFVRYGVWVQSNSPVVHPIIKNCTAIRLEQSPRGFNAAYINGPVKVYNCVFIVGDDPLTGSGTGNTPTVTMNTGSGGGAGYPFVEECVAYGTGADSTDFRFNTSYQAFNNCFSQTQVAANGNPILVDAPNQDYHPDPTGVAYQAGDTANAPAKDLDDNDFDNPPSIGCLEAVASGGGGGGGAVMKSRAGLLPSPFTLNP
tara:strand:- start:142 stop:1263 length:1122 start_codon:yes stop_codon:yes gene_type:complete